MASRTTKQLPNIPKLDGVVRLASVKREEPPPDTHGLYAELQRRVSARVTKPEELELRFLVNPRRVPGPRARDRELGERISSG